MTKQYTTDDIEAAALEALLSFLEVQVAEETGDWNVELLAALGLTPEQYREKLERDGYFDQSPLDRLVTKVIPAVERIMQIPALLILESAQILLEDPAHFNRVFAKHYGQCRDPELYRETRLATAKKYLIDDAEENAE